MALSQRFSDVKCDVNVSSLKVDQTYPIAKVERVKTRYEETILLSFRDPQVTPPLLKVFLPKSYTAAFVDDNITSINGGQIMWNLVYTGLCERTNTHILTIE